MTVIAAEQPTHSLVAALSAPYRPATTPARYESLDGLRFLAALAIVFVHANIMAEGYGWGEAASWLLPFNLCVDFFFALSGFVIETSYGGRVGGRADYVRFLRARAARLYPLHLLTLLACVPLCWLAADGAHFRPLARWLDLSAAPAQLLMLQSFGMGAGLNVASWSLSAEFACYLLFPLALALLRRARPAGALLVATGIFAVFAAIHPAWTAATTDFGVFRALPAFLAGAALSALARDLPPLGIGARHVGLVALSLALFMACGVAPALIVALLPFAVLIAALSEREGAPGPLGCGLMRRLGDASFGVYMVHLPLIYVLAEALNGLKAPPAAKTAALFVLAPTLAVAIALPLRRWFERPLQRALGPKPRARAVSPLIPRAAAPASAPSP